MYQLYQVLATNAFIAGKFNFKKWFFKLSSFYMPLVGYTACGHSYEFFTSKSMIYSVQLFS